jgi:hypothetical protein
MAGNNNSDSGCYCIWEEHWISQAIRIFEEYSQLQQEKMKNSNSLIELN